MAIGLLLATNAVAAQELTLGDVFDMCEPVVSGAELPSLEKLPLKRLDGRTMVARLDTTSGPVTLRYFRDAGGSSPVTRCWIDGYDARDQDNLTDPDVMWGRTAPEIRTWFERRGARPDAKMVGPVIGAGSLFVEICTDAGVPLTVLAGPNAVQSDVPEENRPFSFWMQSPVNNNSTECKFVK
ncbi:hypothetical protein A8B82_22460 [Sulfitobacter sp. EhC04]|nr:hypothetical protein A8B82_22460 [Sulfitobacter sp. EhC04]